MNIRWILWAMALCTARVLGLSWLACSDYRGNITGLANDYNSAFCRGYGRNWNGPERTGDINMFGSDRNYEYRAGRKGRPCQYDQDLSTNYSPLYPMARYEAGKSYTLVWPAKGYGNGPDYGLDVYACCDNDCTKAMYEDIREFKAESERVGRYPRNTANGSLGFGNCPNKSSPDDAVCFQPLEIPYSFAPYESSPALCSFVWVWSENRSRDQHTTCFDAIVFPSLDPPNESGKDPVTVCRQPFRQENEPCRDLFVDPDPINKCCLSGLVCTPVSGSRSLCLNPSTDAPTQPPTTEPVTDEPSPIPIPPNVPSTTIIPTTAFPPEQDDVTLSVFAIAGITVGGIVFFSCSMLALRGHQRRRPSSQPSSAPIPPPASPIELSQVQAE